MATDGLWEMLTNEEVIGLVGQWLEGQSSNLKVVSNSSSNSWLGSWFGSSQNSSLPIEHHDEGKTKGQRAPIRQQQWGVPTGQEERFVYEDKNAATHLVPSPYSRRYRDDLTVQVIFFGEGEGNGKVELNREASATANGTNGSNGIVNSVKAKL